MNKLIVVLDRPRLDVARAVLDRGVSLLATLTFDVEFAWQVEEWGGRALTMGPTAASLRGKTDMLWRCHSVEELPAAADAGFVSLSPVYPTRSKPGYGPPLGLGVFARASRPVYALGGVDSPQRAAECVAAGAAGVAVMGAVMRAADPGRMAELFVQALR